MNCEALIAFAAPYYAGEVRMRDQLSIVV